MRQKIGFLLAALALILFNAWPIMAQNTPCWREQGGAKWVAGVLAGDGCEWEMQSGSTLDVQAGVTESHANDVTFSGVITLSGTVVEDGVASTGPVIFGSQINATDGTTVTHGLGTTPTIVLVTPVTASLTGTVFVEAVNSTVFTIGVESADTGLRVDWLVGK
jgi:hypothetical protein